MAHNSENSHMVIDEPDYEDEGPYEEDTRSQISASRGGPASFPNSIIPQPRHTSDIVPLANQASNLALDMFHDVLNRIGTNKPESTEVITTFATETLKSLMDQ